MPGRATEGRGCRLIGGFEGRVDYCLERIFSKRSKGFFFVRISRRGCWKIRGLGVSRDGSLYLLLVLIEMNISSKDLQRNRAL